MEHRKADSKRRKDGKVNTKAQAERGSGDIPSSSWMVGMAGAWETGVGMVDAVAGVF
jgi:hypothetical protein